MAMKNKIFYDYNFDRDKSCMHIIIYDIEHDKKNQWSLIKKTSLD